MAITSVGYEGEINESQWAEITTHLGTPYAMAGDSDWAVTAVAGQDRTISIAPGTGYGHGVKVTSDAPESIQLPTIAAGSRWDLIACNRDWTPAVGGLSTFVYRQGTATQAIPSTREIGPGSSDDQPIALVQVTAGQTLPTSIVPLRVWASKVLTADSLMALPDSPYGTEAVVGGTRYRRVKDSFGSVAWVVDDTGWLTGSKLPITFLAGWADSGSRVRKRDGIVEAHFVVRRTGANLVTSDVNGGLVDTSILTMNSGYRASHNVVPGSYYNTTQGSFGCATVMSPGGTLTIMSGAAGIDFRKNDQLQAHVSYMAA